MSDEALDTIREGLEKSALSTYELVANYFDSHPDHVWTGREVAAVTRGLGAHVRTAFLIERGYE